MKIGIIVAMGKELKLLLPLIGSPRGVEAEGFTFYTGRAGGHEVVAMQCGIGKVNSALGTLTMIRLYGPDMVVNTGVAGGAGGGAGIMDVVVGERVAYHDVWCGPGTEWGDAAGCPRYFRSDEAVVDKLMQGASEQTKRGLIASGDIFVSCVEEVERIKALYPDVMAVDMESASIAQTCYRCGVPVVVIRVISDTPGGADNISQYEDFWEKAPEHTFEVLTRTLACI